MKRKQLIALMSASMLALTPGSSYLVHAQEPDTINEEASSVSTVDSTRRGSSDESGIDDEAGEATAEKDEGQTQDASAITEYAVPVSPSEAATTQVSPKANGISLDEAHFPDKSFREDLQKKYDKDNDGILSSTEISNITSYYVATDVEDVTGIEYLTNLTTFSAARDSLINVDLSKNTKLKEVSISKTPSLVSLNVSGCTELETLICNENSVTVLDVSSNPALRKLECRSNKLAELNTGGNPFLETLNCGGNPITSLDVSQNTNLQTLDCKDTSIASLDVSGNTMLSTLNCSGDAFLTSLNVSANTELTKLYCGDTSLTSLDISKNTKLTYLNCSGTQMPLDVSANTELTALYCDNMGLDSIDLSHNTKLSTVSCKDNNLTMLDVTNNDLIARLYVSGNHLFDIIGIGENQYVDLTDKNTIQRHTVSIPAGCTSIDMKELYPDFNHDKVCENRGVNGAVLEGTVLKKVTPGTEITYDYVVGPRLYPKDEKRCIDIRINVLGENSWTSAPSIADWTYGEAASTPTGKAAFGDVVFTYSSSPDGEFTADVPTDAGTYYMKASVAEGDSYGALETVVSFTIHAAENSWIEEPAIADWEEGSAPSTPTAKAAVGNPVFTYSSNRDGAFTADVPTTAGTYYMKAAVEAKNYTPLETIVKFQITKKTDSGSDSGSDKPGTPGKNDGKPASSSNENSNSSVHKAARTGDMSSIALLVSSLAASAGCGTLCLRKRKKEADK